MAMVMPLRKKFSSRTTLIFLGLEGAGKTSVVRKLMDLDYNCPPDFILPTIGCAIERTEFMKTSLVLIDMSGQSYFRHLVAKYQHLASGFVFVVDCSDPTRFGEAQLELVNLRNWSKLHGTPILVLASKQDRSELDGADLIREQLEVDYLLKGLKYVVLSCNVHNSDGVRQCFKTFLELVTD